MGNMVKVAPMSAHEKIRLLKRWANYLYVAEMGFNNDVGKDFAELVFLVLNNTPGVFDKHSKMLRWIAAKDTCSRAGIWKYIYVAQDGNFPGR